MSLCQHAVPGAAVVACHQCQCLAASGTCGHNTCLIACAGLVMLHSAAAVYLKRKLAVYALLFAIRALYYFN